MERSINRTRAASRTTSQMRSRLATLVSRGLAARLASADEGVTSIEYALIGALIAIVIIGAVTTIGTDLQSVFNTVASDL